MAKVTKFVNLITKTIYNSVFMLISMISGFIKSVKDNNSSYLVTYY